MYAMTTRSPADIVHGPIFIGVMINVCLYGVMITQTYLYFCTYKQDKLWMKCFVVLIFVADTLNTVFDIVYLYNTLILHFGDVSALRHADWVFETDPALTGIIATLVQLFYAWRVKVLTGNNYLVASIVMCAVTGFFGALATTLAVVRIPNFVAFRKFKVVVIIWLAAECVGDVFITCSLVGYLQRYRAGLSRNTSTIVNRIIRLTIQTGMVTAICAVVDLILYLIKSTGIHLVFNMPLCKLYTNSLMSTLNARGGWSFAEGTTWSSEEGLRGRSSESDNRHSRYTVDLESNRVPEARQELRNSRALMDGWVANGREHPGIRGGTKIPAVVGS